MKDLYKIDCVYGCEEGPALYIGSMYSYFENEETFRDSWISDVKSWKISSDGIGKLQEKKIKALVVIMNRSDWDDSLLLKAGIKVLKLAQVDRDDPEAMKTNVNLAIDFIESCHRLGMSVLSNCE